MGAFSDVAGSVKSSQKLINLLKGHVSSSPHSLHPVIAGPHIPEERWPNTALLPTQLLEKATHNVLKNKTIAFPAMCYGPDDGDPRLLRNVASWLTKFYQPADPISENRLCITGGASQNLACLLQVFSDPIYTRHVFLVSPAYMLCFRIFEDAGFHTRLRAVPEDDEGIDIDFLERQLEKSEEKAKADGNDEPPLKPSRPWSKIYKYVIYAVPTFSNPSSKTMSLKRREQLVRLARQYDALIITDDVYDFLQWPSSLTTKTLSVDKAVLPRIVDIDRYLDGGADREGADGFGNTASNGSFSKICGPGLRTGWCEGTAKLAHGVSQTGSSRSGGAPSQLTACFVAETLETGELQRYVFEQLQPIYGARYRKMVEAINTHLIPLGVRLPQADREIVGGYFIWLTLPHSLKGANFAQRAKDEENVVVAQIQVPGDTEGSGTSFENDIRICFAWEDEDMLAEGIKRLAQVIRRMLDEHTVNNDDTSLVTAANKPSQDAKDFW
ncbi:PLP-dependent transferase [Dothidotthia symphoricarpi CBS 119687]|uniref:PLP-dependent transferase n=1 Tax=Dothidotthia symphoricarpi CBS 119687 TaxID=1392245 RepID=A0A6A6A0Y0_9PLEO|nr:PLP-dependent transferase [Dothidotthia symphoricarpi CBS 119687]KAF2124813.1 PLP-dependent transferase [Dothidotthia symphoricarpi CBS 119687]